MENCKEKENKVYLNNVVYDLEKIQNPKLKQALQQRGDSRFMFEIFRSGSHKDEINISPRRYGPNYEEHIDIPHHCESHHVEAYSEYKDSCYGDYS